MKIHIFYETGEERAPNVGECVIVNGAFLPIYYSSDLSTPYPIAKHIEVDTDNNNCKVYTADIGADIE